VVLLFVRKHFTLFICSSHWWTSPEFSTFNRGQITSELGKPPRNLCSYQLLSCKSHFWHFESFHGSFPPPALNKTLLNNHTCYSRLHLYLWVDVPLSRKNVILWSVQEMSDRIKHNTLVPNYQTPHNIRWKYEFSPLLKWQILHFIHVIMLL